MARALEINYDLKKPGQAYPALYDTIVKQSNGSYLHVLESTWLIATDKTVDQVAEAITAIVDSTDSFYVVDITGARYQGLLTEKQWKWFKQWV